MQDSSAQMAAHDCLEFGRGVILLFVELTACDEPEL